jgi:hydrogenase-1 operon protein HyaF
MNAVRDFKPFPIPVVSADAPSDFAQDDGLNYLAMPKDMETYRPPMLPEPGEIAQQTGAVQALHQVLAALEQVCAEQGAHPHTTLAVPLLNLAAQDLALINQVLGEGEVSAQVLGGNGQPVVQIQESVFAGVWRVIEVLSDGAVRDCIELGAIPEVLRQTARQDALAGARAQVALPPEVMNVPSVMVELDDRRHTWQSGQDAHVVNLSLLPLAPPDIAHLDSAPGGC